MDRAQAFTLEGFIASVLVLAAVLFALEAVVISPTTAGTVDRDIQSGIRAETNDILTVAGENDSLSYLVRYWDPGNDTYYGAADSTIGYGAGDPPTGFGTMLNQTLRQRGHVYNVIAEYRGRDDPTNAQSQRMVYRGVPSDNAIVATYTITLYDDMPITSPAVNKTIKEAHGDGEYPIPDAAPNSPVYNVVEIRVMVW